MAGFTTWFRSFLFNVFCCPCLRKKKPNKNGKTVEKSSVLSVPSKTGSLADRVSQVGDSKEIPTSPLKYYEVESSEVANEVEGSHNIPDAVDVQETSDIYSESLLDFPFNDVSSESFYDIFSENNNSDKETENESVSSIDEALEEQEPKICSEGHNFPDAVEIQETSGTEASDKVIYSEEQDALEEQEPKNCSEGESAKVAKIEFKKGPYQFMYEQLYGTPNNKPYDLKYPCNEREFLTEEELKQFPEPPTVNSYKEHQDVEKKEIEIESAGKFDDAIEEQEHKSCSDGESAKVVKIEIKKGPYQLLYEQLYGTYDIESYKDLKYNCNEREFLTEEELKQFPEPPKVSTYKEHQDVEKSEDDVLTVSQLKEQASTYFDLIHKMPITISNKILKNYPILEETANEISEDNIFYNPNFKGNFSEDASDKKKDYPKIPSEIQGDILEEKNKETDLVIRGQVDDQSTQNPVSQWRKFIDEKTKK